MSFKHRMGNWILSLAMSLLYFRWVRDSQSGMWVFRRSILKDICLESDGMAFSEEIKIEALKSPRVRFAEISILYSSRLGEIKLNPWRDGFYNLFFLVKKRFSRGEAQLDEPRRDGNPNLEPAAAVTRSARRSGAADLSDRTRDCGGQRQHRRFGGDGRSAGAEVIGLGANRGFAAAVNRGIRAGRLRSGLRS